MAIDYLEKKLKQICLIGCRRAHKNPQLLRGAWQVGKSSTVRHLGTRFDNPHYGQTLIILKLIKMQGSCLQNRNRHLKIMLLLDTGILQRLLG